MKKEIYFIIPAAGIGTRMESQIPKQYLEIAGKTVLTHTLALFLASDKVMGGVVVLSPDDTTEIAIQDDRLWQVVGGDTRTDSVTNGLRFLSEKLIRAGKDLDNIWVAVHDAARPGLRVDELNQFLQAVIEDDPQGGAIMALPAQDTVKLVGNGDRIEKTLDRAHIWLAQTPQMAPLSLLLKASERAVLENAIVTDEASLLEYNGYFPKVYRGYVHNLKITYPEDLQLMTLYFSEREK